MEGTKTIAFEIAEQLGWETPDHIICPIGFGSVYMGLYIGFQELQAQGIITKLPRLLGHRLKLDFVCPTGSYKDRGAALLLSKVKELGVQAVVENPKDSSGNAMRCGAAIAAYSAKAGIDCTIYCPASTSKGKLAQIS